MKAAQFELKRPATLDAALQLLADPAHDSKVLSGGQSLAPLLALRMARPTRLVDIGRVPGLAHVSISAEAVTLGARVRWRDILANKDLAAAHPLLHHAIGHVAHYQIRNRGTVGGSLAHADPAAEMPAVAVACDATIAAASLRGTRWLPAADFFLGPLTTALEPDEIITAVRLPAWPPDRRWAFEEYARRTGDFALAGTIVHFRCDAAGRCSNPVVTVFGVAERALRLPAIEAMIDGITPDRAALLAAAAAARHAFAATSDLHAPAAYRSQLASVLIERALLRAAGLPADTSREAAA